MSLVCEHCAGPFAGRTHGRQSLPRYCSPSCRWAAHRGRWQVVERCSSCGVEFEASRAESRVYCSPACAWRAHAGAGNGRWSGGRRVEPNGYVAVLMPGHPRARANGYVYEHQLVAETSLGRFLTTAEVVHHVNHVKTDNRPENLRVMTRAAHTALHMAERKSL